MDGDSHDSSNSWSTRYTGIIQTITVVSIFVSGFWLAVIQPISETIKKVETNTLTLREYEEFKLDVNRRFEQIQTEVESLRTAQVTRAEHERHWADSDSKLNNIHEIMQKQIDDLKTQIDQMNNQINQLNRLDQRNQFQNVVPNLNQNGNK